MADNTFDTTTNTDCVQNDSEAVCIDANRVYDSCGDKDCLSDIRVYFADANQTTIDNAVSVRIKDATVLNVSIDLDTVPFHRGFYSIDMTFYFDISLDVYVSTSTTPVTINGLSIFQKRCILYGSEGSVQVFSSDDTSTDLGTSRNLPRATVQVAKPIALAAKLVDFDCNCTTPIALPTEIATYFGSDVLRSSNKSILATIGMFTIVQIERNVQMLVPSYSFCIPEKECQSSSDNPCDIFSRIEFPTDEFFPPKVCELDDETRVGCCCNKNR